LTSPWAQARIERGIFAEKYHWGCFISGGR
jgi:hypothetical protein